MPPIWRAPEGLEGLAAVPVGGGGAWPDNESTRPPQTHFAHNFPRSLVEIARKRCNPNDMNSMFEVLAGELRAKLMGEQPVRQRAGPGCGARGRRGLLGLVQATQALPAWRVRRVRRAWAGLEIDHSERSSRVAISRAAGPDGAQNTSGATSNAAGGPPPTSTPSSPAPHTAKPPGPCGAGRLTQHQRIIEESRQYQDHRDRFPGARSRCRASRRCPWRCLPSGDPRRRR